MARRGRGIFGRATWNKLSPSGRAAYDRALDALARMRTDGLSLSRAAREAGTTPAVVRKYVGSALHHTRRGTAPKPADRLYRRMTAITPDGPVTVEVRGSRAASLLSRHANAVQTFVQTGNARVLRAFRGKSVGGHELASDPNVLRRLARRGELDVDEIYELTA